jgi:hypothetical protein
MVKQTRTGTLATCNLTMHANTGTHAFDLLPPVGLSLADGACGSSINLTLLSDPSP